ncbi:hypothetical protein K443DRAFT_199625 [Laccaria amethystina LaAM-08-1]|uniref:Uncharacterized protein n=1 Tax=Laccaria amethystina LaAM-08-1 TaxID=1095629 RepID=A0A0C9YGQ5_9AGAR|nr:hypothetical protein K443DRAFT_199625 [Laccaria amethystina LaAM-08-1]
MYCECPPLEYYTYIFNVNIESCATGFAMLTQAIRVYFGNLALLSALVELSRTPGGSINASKYAER